jgi:hypothetical protein
VAKSTRTAKERRPPRSGGSPAFVAALYERHARGVSPSSGARGRSGRARPMITTSSANSPAVGATAVSRPRAGEARRGASRSAPLVRDTTRSHQLVCIQMAKGPPAADEGSFSLVVPHQQRLEARRLLPPLPDARQPSALASCRGSSCERIGDRAAAASRPAWAVADQPSSTRLLGLRSRRSDVCGRCRHAS